MLRDCAASTRKAYLYDLEHFAVMMDCGSNIEAAIDKLLTLEADDADKMVISMRQRMITAKKSVNYINRRIAVIRRLVSEAQRRGAINWSLGVRKATGDLVRATKGLTADEAKKLIQVLANDRTVKGIRDFAIMVTMLDLGLRRASICALNIEDVNLAKKTITVRLKGKDAPKVKDLQGRAHKAISDWLTFYPKQAKFMEGEKAPLFVNAIKGHWNRLTGAGLHYVVRRSGRAAGFKTLRPHALRHSAITIAVNHAAAIGRPITEVLKLSDHKDIRMLQRYVDTDEDAQKRYSSAIENATS